MALLQAPGSVAYATAGAATSAPPNGLVSIPNPVPGSTVTDSFGDTRSGGRRHAGIDLMAPAGTPVFAPIGGTVSVAGSDNGAGGNRVWITGMDGLAYYFAHLRDIVVTVGQTIAQGAQIGTVGNTGNAAGGSPHLHFSINKTIGAENPVVNPFDVIQGSTGADVQQPQGPVQGTPGVNAPASGGGAATPVFGSWGTIQLPGGFVGNIGFLFVGVGLILLGLYMAFRGSNAPIINVSE